MQEGDVVTVQRWPVLARIRGTDGALRRGKNSYRRTAAPLEERDIRLTTFVTRTRVRLYFGQGDHPRLFSLNTGRGVGMADWVIRDGSLRELRKEAKALFPDEARALERALRALSGTAGDGAADDDDDESLVPANDVAS